MVANRSVEAPRSSVAGLSVSPERGVAVPLYLAKFSMTPEAWAKLIREPEDRRETVGRLLEAAGGKLLGYWYAFGDHDGYVLGEAADNVAIASALVSVAGSGAFRSLSTTVLMTVDETLEALRRAQSISYRPPGG